MLIVTPVAKKQTTTSSPAPAAATYGPALPVALFKGDDAYLRTAYTDKLRAAIEKAGVPVDVIRFDGNTAQPAEVLDECRSFGLIAQHKIVIVDNADEFLKESEDEEDAPPAAPARGKRGTGGRGAAPLRTRDLLEAYVKSPTPGATLVLRAETWRKGNLDQLIEAVGIVEDCNSPTPDKAVAALVRRAQATHNTTLEPDAAWLIVERLGTNLGALVQELAKLAALAGEGKPITLQHVKEMVGVAKEDEAWNHAPALLSGSAELALTKARELMEVSRVDEVLLRFVVMDAAKKVHAFTRAAAQGIPPGVVGKEMKVWPPDRAAMFQHAAKNLTPKSAADLLTSAVETDSRGKSGRGDVTLGVETAIVGFVRETSG